MSLMINTDKLKRIKEGKVNPCLWKDWEKQSLKNGPHNTIYWISKNKKYTETLINGGEASKYVNGDQYQGYWKNNKKDGYGIQIWQNGRRYEGEWEEGKMSGKGIMWIRTKDGKLKKQYNGEWRNGKRTGLGVYYYSPTHIYEGSWVDDKRNGKGRMMYENGDIYEGYWVNDKREGAGVMVYANGDRYEGNWVNDVKQGSGRYFYIKTNKLYEGEWFNDTAKCGIFHDIPNVDESGVIETNPDAEHNFQIPTLELENEDAVLTEAIQNVRNMQINNNKHGLGGIDLNAEEMKYLTLAFQNVDKEGKGYIYGYDLYNLLQYIGVEVNESQMSDIFALLECESESAIDFSQFCELMRVLKQ